MRPFAWWVACVVDQCSRRVLGFEVFEKKPDSAAMEKLFSETIEKTRAKPDTTYRGRQFECQGVPLVVEFHKGRRHLPIVRLREKAA